MARNWHGRNEIDSHSLNKVIMFKILGIVLSIMVGISIAASGPRDIGAEMLQSHAKAIFMITPPSRDNTGCTAFNVRVPSGAKFMVTNEHCSALAENGLVRAHYTDGRTALVRLIEVSAKTDLSLFQAVPDAPALEIANWHNLYARLNVVGHPRLAKNTYSEGRVVGRDFVDIVEQSIPLDKCVGPRLMVRNITIFFGIKIPMCVKSTEAIQTSVVIYGGNSGSPVMDDDGQVVGVMFAGDTTTNYGSMVPLDALNDFIKLY